MPRKRHDRVVNDDDVAQVSVFDDSQVFDEDVGSWLDAVLSVKAVFNNAVFVVDKVKHCVCVLLFPSCKDAYLVHTRQVLQDVL